MISNRRQNFTPDSFVCQIFIKFGWIVSTLMFIGAFVGPASMGSINYVYNPTHGAIYNAFAPIGWCGLFAWIAFLSHTGNSNGE
jgi:hypothetical protein